MASSSRPVAVVTGASSGIGYELASIAAAKGYDLVVASDEPTIRDAATAFGAAAVAADPVQADLATIEGVDRLYGAIGERPVDLLLANAGHGLGGGFLDQPFEAVLHVVNTNVVGTIDLIQRVGRGMRARGAGRLRPARGAS